MRYVLMTVALALALCGCSRKSSDPDRPGTTQTTGASDNMSANERDRSGVTTTPLDQAESAVDLETNARIRRLIMEDSTLSFDGKNVKVMTSGGVVTLRGPVRDERERVAIGDDAARIPGVLSVDNQLEIIGNGN